MHRPGILGKAACHLVRPAVVHRRLMAPMDVKYNSFLLSNVQERGLGFEGRGNGGDDVQCRRMQAQALAIQPAYSRASEFYIHNRRWIIMPATCSLTSCSR